MSVALVAGFMTLLDVSIVNVALPSIRSDLGLGSGQLQWVLSGYALTFGLLLVPAGRFGDARGRRSVFITGLAVFTLASAAAGLATGPLWLVVARLVQGAAAGVISPQVSGLIQQLFEPRCSAGFSFCSEPPVNRPERPLVACAIDPRQSGRT